MERVNNPEKLQDRIDKHETLDLLQILDSIDPVKEYELLLQKRTTRVLEEINSNLSVISATLMSISNSMAAGATDQRGETADNEQ